ncbi:MAG: protein kinase [Planctomycetaceae bacterium]
MADATDDTQLDERLPATAIAEDAGPLDDTVEQDAAAQARAVDLSGRDLQPPAGVPGYTIRRKLGEGAYGSVWLALERNTGKQVAIKFYSHRRGLDWSLLNREVEKLAVLYTSRNIVGLLDVGWNSDPPYYVMEHLQNGSLAALLRDGPLPPHEATRIAQSVLQALVHAHGSGILHCDLKPANVLLDTDYEPRLCDFGQSRLSDEQNPSLGTLFYMAPEQADLNAVPDARWDVYALGALFYEMLVGEAPFRTPENERRIRAAKTLGAKLTAYRRALRESPKPTAHRGMRGVDRRLTEIIDRCLRIDPTRRYPNAQAVLDALVERDRQRARRPLMILGILFPIILLALMLPLAGDAGNKAVDTSTQTLTQRAIESDVVSANVVADSIRRDLEDRRDELRKIADEVDITAMLKRTQAEIIPKLEADLKSLERKQDEPRAREESWKERSDVFSELGERKRQSDRRRGRLRRSQDQSWFVTDAKGYQRWRLPKAFNTTLDRRFHYRDYFHGHGREYPPDDAPDDLHPIEDPHVSLAFRSKHTNEFMVAISVPIYKRLPDGGFEVVGVLARTINLGDLLADYSSGLKRKERDVARSVVLVENADGKLLDHPWMTPKNLRLLSQDDEEFHSLTLDPAVRRQILRLQDATSTGETGPDAKTGTIDKPSRTARDTARDSYRDPVGSIDVDYDGEWLAAFAPVENVGWTVIVQERKSRALEPIDKITNGLIKSAIWALSLFIGLIVAVWALVVWRLNDRPMRIGINRNGNGRRKGAESGTPQTK